jgi:hypothetical protein
MTRIAHARRTLLTGAALAVAGVLVVGCGSQGSSSQASGPLASGSPSATGGTTAPAAANAPATPMATSGTVAAGSPAAASGSSTGSGGTNATPECTTSDLKTSVGNGGGGTAGAYYSVIDFTNSSGASCTLYGYPGVSLRGAQLALIGAPATRNATPVPSLVTLAPGATANAVLRMTDPGVYATAECGPVTSAYLQVYPPNQTQPAELPFSGSTCSRASVKILAVSTVTLGTGS